MKSLFFLLLLSSNVIADVGQTVCTDGTTTFVREESDEFEPSRMWTRVGDVEGGRKNPSTLRMLGATKKVESATSSADSVEELYTIDATVTYRPPRAQRRVETLTLKCLRYLRKGE